MNDNGLEFCNEEFDSYYKEHSILRHKIVRRTLQLNGVAESMNKTLLNKARCMMFGARLPKPFLGEAIMIATYLVNRSPSSVLEFKTLEEKWNKKPLSLDHLRPFGSLAYAHQSKEELEPKAIKCIFLGFPQGVKGYRLWVKDNKGFKTIISRDVIFSENIFPYLSETNHFIGKDFLDTNPTGTIEDHILVESSQVMPNQVESIPTKIL